jgi:hypothetical protein
MGSGVLFFDNAVHETKTATGFLALAPTTNRASRLPNARLSGRFGMEGLKPERLLD